MACNCKRLNEFQDKHGIPQDETLFRKIFRYCYKILLLIITILLVFIVTPIMVFVIFYKMLVRKGEPLVLPQFLSKYLKK